MILLVGGIAYIQSISLDKTPPVVGGKIEMFGSITDMISQWEGMEEEGVRSEDDLSVDKRGRKRLSKAIRNLSEKFEKRNLLVNLEKSVEVRGGGKMLYKLYKS